MTRTEDNTLCPNKKLSLKQITITEQKLRAIFYWDTVYNNVDIIIILTNLT